ncbi:MAG: hypothetical protein GY703_09275 [Gammaproteobacteria bacterium]|nr:hypothetical protein [Gammaproteobacteria bacterium]
MTTKLSKTAQRIAAILILLAVVTMVLAISVLPVVMASASYRESIDDLTFRMQRYERTAAMEVPLKTRLTQLESQQIAKEDLLSGESTAITGANLQELFKQRVQQSGGRLESTQILSESNDGYLQRIAIKARFTGNIEALQKTLYNIEFQKPLLFVDNLEIRSKSTNRRSRRKGKKMAQQLTITMDVAGYRRDGGQD